SQQRNGGKVPVQTDSPPAQRSAEHRLISDRLATFLRENYQASRQSLIFLNRRGFSNYLQCTLCGHVLRCSYCIVRLTLHMKQKSVCFDTLHFTRASTVRCS